jgi:hypothetical protein
MPLTHEQAQQLIQLKVDKIDDVAQNAALSAHLQHCSDCQAYARELDEVERTLTHLLERQWGHQPAPLPIASLTQEVRSGSASGVFLAMRTAAISLIFLGFFFSAWQFVGPNRSAPGPAPLAGLPVPTPSGSSTSTSTALEGCELVLYTVGQGDSLASIARRFSVSEEEIMAANGLTAGPIGASVQLLIPICHFTPTGTVHPATFTSTLTPADDPLTSTPGG